MLTPQATAILIDSAIPDANRGLLGQIALGLLATAFGSTLFQLAQGVALMRLDTFANSSIQAGIWDRLLTLKVSFFRQYAIGDLNSRVSAISQIHQKLSNTVLKTIFSSVFSLLNLGLLFFYSPPLALIAVAVALINIAVTIVSGILTLRQVRPLLERQGKLSGVVVQLINGVTKLRVAGAESRAFAYWGKEYRQQLKLILSTQRIEDSLAVINQVLTCDHNGGAVLVRNYAAEAVSGLIHRHISSVQRSIRHFYQRCNQLEQYCRRFAASLAALETRRADS